MGHNTTRATSRPWSISRLLCAIVALALNLAGRSFCDGTSGHPQQQPDVANHVEATTSSASIMEASVGPSAASVGLPGEAGGEKGNNEKVESSNNNTGVKSQSSSAASIPCGIWLATSTIPNAGLGIFAGRDFARNEQLQEMGDVAIPIGTFSGCTFNLCKPFDLTTVPQDFTLIDFCPFQ